MRFVIETTTETHGRPSFSIMQCFILYHSPYMKANLQGVFYQGNVLRYSAAEQYIVLLLSGNMVEKMHFVPPTADCTLL